MPQLTLLEVTGFSPIEPKLTVHKVAGAGTVLIIPQLTVHKVAGAGTVAVVVNPPSGRTVEPLAIVTLTATLQNGLTADSWTWRQISGPPASIVGTTRTVTLTAPAMAAGATVVVGVAATVGSSMSTEKTVTVTVLPQIEWRLDAGGVWRPLPPATVL